MKFLIIALFLGVVFSLGSALKYLMQDEGHGNRVVWALTWRVGLSILLFLFLLVAHWLGWLETSGLQVGVGS